MKKLLVIIFFLLSVLVLFPLFHWGIFTSHDGVGHIVRFAQYAVAIADGQMPVRWSGTLNYTFGSPVFIFFYPLPYYLGVLLKSIGFTYEQSFMFLIGIMFLSAFVSFFLWSKHKTSTLVAFVSSSLYLLAPYHFLDIYVRGDIGELTAFVFLPLVFLFIDRNNTKVSLFNIVIGGLCFALLILAHNGISLMFAPIILLYIVLSCRKKEMVFSQGLLVVTGLALSAFFWIPALYERRYLSVLAIFDQFYVTQFTSITKLFYSPWNFGANVNQPNGLSPQIGFLQIALVIFSFVMLFKLKNKKFIAFWLVVFFSGIFLSLPYSSFLYEHISLLRQFQFPWRFLALSYVAVPVLVTLVVDRKQKIFLIIILIIAVLQSVSFIKVQGYESHSDSYYQKSQDSTAYHSEATTKWTAGNEGNFPTLPIEIIGGKGSISFLAKKSNSQEFVIDAQEQVHVLDNTVYFPGWRVTVDNQKVPIEFQDMNHRGLITFTVPQGRHMINVRFREDTIRLISDMISLTTLLILVILGVVGVGRYYLYRFMHTRK